MEINIILLSLDKLCMNSTGYKNRKLDYDKEKYREMILDAAETVLGYFGFDRTVYGNKTTKR